MQCNKELARFYTFTEWKRDKTPTEVHHALVEVWHDEAPGYSTVARWMSDYASERRETFEDATRSGRPISASKNDSIAVVRETVLQDPRLSTRAISDLIGIPQKTVWRILSVQLQMRRLAAYWVPQNLTEQQRMNRVISAQAILQQLTVMGDQRYDLYAMEDETWINFDVKFTTSSAKQWLPEGAPRPRAVTSKLTPRKCLVMVVFCPSKRFHVQALPYGVTVDGDVYRDFVRDTGHKWQCLKTNPVSLKDLIWQHDNARPHTRKDVASFFQWRKIALLHQAPYSPDLNLCDRWLFAHVKRNLRQQQFNSHLEVQDAFLRELQAISKDVFQRQVNLLIAHCEKVIAAQGDYVVPSN
jgi:transposase